MMTIIAVAILKFVLLLVFVFALYFWHDKREVKKDLSMPLRYAILKGRKVCPATLEQWATQFDSSNRIVNRTQIGDSEVSTVFLGLNHGMGSKEIWFETLVFGGDHDGKMFRYETYDEAERGHLRMCEAVRAHLIFCDEIRKQENASLK